MYRVLVVVVGVALLQLAGAAAAAELRPVLLSVDPDSGGISGGTVVTVRGENFVAGGSCAFEDPSLGSAVSQLTTLLSPSHLECTMPALDYLSSVDLAGGHFVRLSVTSGLVSRSNLTEFLVYDVEAISIAAVSPSEGLHYVTNDIIIQGQGFINTGDVACHILSDDTRLTFHATFVSPTELQCTLPALPSPALHTVSVSLNEQEATLIPSTRENTLFTFSADPPFITAAVLNSAYTTLHLIFDREVELGGVATPPTPIVLTCGAVFTADTLATLGVEAQCSWHNSQQRRITVSLPPSSTATQHSLLTVSDRAIRTRHTSYSRHASGSINVTLPASPLVPIAVLEAPQTLPSCGHLTLESQNSQGGGYTPLLYHWDIHTLHGEEVSESLKSYFPTGFSSLSYITLHPSLLQPDTGYSVQLTVRNFLGSESSTSHTLTPSPSPSSSPPLVIVGGASREVCAHNALSLEATPIDTTPECSSYTGQLEYRWMLENEDGTQVTLEVQTNTSVLTLPPYTLLHSQTYTVVVSTGDDSTNATVIVTTSEPCLVAHITGGDYRVVSGRAAVVLDGGSSAGLTAALLSDPLFSLEWACSTQGLPCLNNEGREVGFPPDIAVSLPPHTLPLGIYTFTLSLHYSHSVTSAAESTVRVAGDSPPQLEVATPNCCGPVPVHSDVTVLATVHSEIPSFVRWTVESVPGYAELELSPLITSSPLTLPILTDTTLTECSRMLLVNVTNQIALTILGGTLLHDNVYRISLEAFNEGAHDQPPLSNAYIDLHTALPPSQGTLSVDASSESTLQSEVTITAEGWTDTPGDTPLMYRFGLRRNGTGCIAQCSGMETAPLRCETVHWISGYSLQPRLVAPLLSYSATDTVDLVVEVMDAGGAVAVTSLQQVLNDSDPAGQQSAMQALESVGRKVTEEGRWREGLAGLAVLFEAVEHNDSLFSNASAARAAAVETLVHIYEHHLPSSPSHLTLLLSLLHQASLTLHLSASTARQTASAVREATAMLASLSETATPENLALGWTEKVGVASAALDTLFSLVLEYSSGIEWRRVQENKLTSDLMLSLPLLAHGLCQQMGIGESELLSITDEGGTLKIAQSLLLANYSASELCDDDSCSGSNVDDVIIDFNSELFWSYSQWSCDANEEMTNQISGSGFESTNQSSAYCFGVCVVTALLNFDLHWQGNQFTHHVVSPVLTLSLLHPLTGHTLTPHSSPLTLTFTISPPSLGMGELLCAVWDGDTMEWNTNLCTTTMVGGASVVCECEFGGEVEAALVERCPSGYYGNNCMEECPQGLWGEECAESCDCSGRGTCSAHDGSCDCDPGWTGLSCQEECEGGRWGKRCVELCLCRNAVSCDHVTGSCDCLHGWTGELCDTACSSGTYGYYCTGECQCRLDSECQRETGVCVCEAGYVGEACLQPCSEGLFGLGCESQCACSQLGTVSCHHVTGQCSCSINYTGSLCNELNIIVTPTVPVEEEPGLAVWVLALPAVVIIIIIVVIATVVMAALFWRKSKRKQVLPIAEECDRGGGGGRVRGDSGEGVRESSSGEGSQDNLLTMTHAKSLEVLIPRGKKLQELFPRRQSDGDVFQEPPEAHTKLRWQVVQVIFQETGAMSEETGFIARETAERRESDIEAEFLPSRASRLLQTESQDLVPGQEDSQKKSEGEGDGGSGEEGRGEGSEGGSEDQAVMVYYKRGIYLDPDATLKDLRNAFLDSGQLEGGNTFFQFLKSDVPGDTVAIETEDETYLRDVEGVEPRTLHFQLLTEEDAGVQTELCVCGRYANMECSECHSQGYCSSACQTQHWLSHAHSCRVTSAHRRRKNRRRKRKQKRKQSHERMTEAVTPGIDLCPCGKEAEFNCSRCNVQGYCNEECQLEDWLHHRTLCFKQEDPDSPQ